MKRTEVISSMLAPGEILGLAFAVTPGDQMWAHDYRVHPVLPENTESNTVIFDIAPYGSTEPLLVVAGIRLAVRALSGRGRAVVYNVPVDRLCIEPLYVGAPPVGIGQGDVYFYTNDTATALVLRDDCTPPFNEGDEACLQDEPHLVVPSAFLRAYGQFDTAQMP